MSKNSALHLPLYGREDSNPHSPRLFAHHTCNHFRVSLISHAAVCANFRLSSVPSSFRSAILGVFTLAGLPRLPAVCPCRQASFRFARSTSRTGALRRRLPGTVARLVCRRLDFLSRTSRTIRRASEQGIFQLSIPLIISLSS